MDNTRVISSTGTPYGMANEKIFKDNGMVVSKGAPPRFDPRKNFINSGGMYTICNRSGGAQILMNTHSIATATSMQFLPPARSKSSLCIDISNMPSISVLKQAHFGATGTSISQPITFFAKTNSHTRTASDLLIEKQNHTPYDISDSNSKFGTDSPGLEKESPERNTFVNKFKSFFSSLIRPIIDTTNMFVGYDNASRSEPQQMPAKQMYWSDTDALNHKTASTIHCDNHSSDSFSYASEKSNYVNFMPETFFDCDDYIDGGEDQIDFVAESTRTPYTHSFGDELIDGDSLHPLSKDYDYYECINKPAVSEEMSTLPSVDPSPVPTPPPDTTEPIEKIDLEPIEVVEDPINGMLDNVQYDDDEDDALISGPKCVQSNRNSYRRKRRGKRKLTNKNRNKKTCSNKNRHEKDRHEVEMNIHDDIEDCNALYPDETEDIQDPAIDVKTINMDEITPKSPSVSDQSSEVAIGPIAATPIVCIETPIPSPEEITSNCIFTRFFRLDNSSCKQKQQSLPLRCMRKLLPQPKPLRERSISTRFLSETESDDSFIVFEDCSPRSVISVDELMPKHASICKRQRQLSECSDDFILFADDADDGAHLHCYTTDEDFTDSTDDSDCSEDETSDDESDVSEFLASSSKRKDDNNQPDSGFEEKKVSFNLCPIVHEIRAWKFAYSEARKGRWEQIGRDRERFEKRVNELSRILSPILSADHRQKIFSQRFQSEEHTEEQHISETF